MKTCTKCCVTKDLAKFRMGGKWRANVCNSCRNENTSAWRASNKEKVHASSSAWAAANSEEVSARKAKWHSENKLIVNAKSAAWRAANREKVRTDKARWYAENRERLIELSRVRGATWRKNNPERKAATGKSWAENNKDKLWANTVKRKAAKVKAIPAWFGELDELVISEAGDLAKRRSVLTGIKHHVDHIVPLRGRTVCGLHCAHNIQVLTAVENISKGNRRWPDMP